MCELIRDVMGDPFRPLPPLPPAVLAWNDSTGRRIAEAIYEERRMPEGTLDTNRLGLLAARTRRSRMREQGHPLPPAGTGAAHPRLLGCGPDLSQGVTAMRKKLAVCLGLVLLAFLVTVAVMWWMPPDEPPLRLGMTDDELLKTMENQPIHQKPIYYVKTIGLFYET